MPSIAAPFASSAAMPDAARPSPLGRSFARARGGGIFGCADDVDDVGVRGGEGVGEVAGRGRRGERSVEVRLERLVRVRREGEVRGGVGQQVRRPGLVECRNAGSEGLVG